MMNKTFILLLIAVFITLSLIIVEPVHSVIPKPSVPEFTVEYDPESHRVILIIQNQPFEPYHDEDANTKVYFYYNVGFSSPGGAWTELYRPSFCFLGQDSLHNYTKVSYRRDLNMDGKLITIPSGEVTFRVEAMIGFVHRQVTGGMAPYVFSGKTSGWSAAQTVTIPARVPAPSDEPPTLEPTETEPEEPEELEPETAQDEQAPEEPTAGSESSELEQLAVILGVVATTISLAALCVGLMVYFKIRKP